MYNTKRIELIVKDWVKLKTGVELSNETISQMVVDITETKQLTLTDVVKSSDLWVVEFSDNEIKLMTSKELQEYENECMDFDGFMGCSVLGRLAKIK